MTNKPVASDEQYWCSLPEEEFATELFSRSIPRGTNGSIHGWLLRAAYSSFYGAAPLDGPGSTAFVGRSGEQGEIVTLRVNQLRSHANARHQLVTSPKLDWDCEAVNTDAKSLSDAARGASILEYLWKQRRYGAQAVEAVLGAIIYGEEFLFTPWDDLAGKALGRVPEASSPSGETIPSRVVYEGDVRCHNVPSWDVLRDGSASSYEESDWLCVRLDVNKWSLIAQHPDMREKILSHQPDDRRGMDQPWDARPTGGDRVTCYFFFHKRTPALPDGMQSVLLGDDCVLSHEPLEDCYDGLLPIHRIACADLKGTPYAWTDFWECMGIQELYDDVQTSLATNIVSFGKQIIAQEEGDVSPVDQLSDGPKLLIYPKGSRPPQAVNLMVPNPEMFQHIERLKQDQRQIMGLNDIVMGQPDSAQMNASAFALLASMAVTQNSDLQARYVEMVSRTGRSILRIYQAKASVKRKVRIVGVHGPSVVQEFGSEDLQNLDDVFVTVGNPLSHTSAGRLQLAQMYVQQGFILTPEQLQSVIEEGTLQPLTQVLRDELLYVAEENEAILRGTNPPVKITDSHMLHIKEHRGPTFSSASRGDARINAAADAHIQEHLQMWLQTDPRILQAMGQSVPQQPAQPNPQAPASRGAAQALKGPLPDGMPQAQPAKIPSNPQDGSPLGPAVPGTKGGALPS